jgi:hypothetical protein
MKSAAHARIAAKEAGAVSKLRAAGQREAKTKPMKSRGMKGRAPTAAEQRFMDAMAALGCVACRKDGIKNPWISIHHIDGRTKEGAHFKVLALCAQHHQQDDSDPMGRISVHGAKAQFEARYGTQAELLAECIALINSGTGTGATAPDPEQLLLEQ